MTEQQFMDFRSKYLDIYDTFAAKGTENQAVIKFLRKVRLCLVSLIRFRKEQLGLTMWILSGIVA